MDQTELFILKEEILKSIEHRGDPNFNLQFGEISSKGQSPDLGYEKIDHSYKIFLANLGLTKIPFTSENLEYFPELKDYIVFLDLQKNRLSTLENIFYHFPKLSYLNLCHNQLTSIEPITSSSLNFLRCGYNKLSRVLIKYRDLPALSYLDISNNEIKSFVIGDECPSLDQINLSINKLVSLKIEASKLPNLYALRLVGNPLKTIEIDFLDFPRLSKLALDKSHKKLIDKTILKELSKTCDITKIS